MKYIRTEDGHIYEIDECGNFVGYQGVWNPNKKLVWWQMETKDKYHVDAPNGYTVCIKQANTIEELCDELVAINYGANLKPILLSVIKFKTEVIKRIAQECEVRGAIWTDKGLTYITKPMTKEGKFELL